MVSRPCIFMVFNLTPISSQTLDYFMAGQDQQLLTSLITRRLTLPCYLVVAQPCKVVCLY